MTDDLAATQALIEQGEWRAALKLLERARSDALAARSLPRLDGVLHLAQLVYGRAEGKAKHESGRIAYAAMQNVRFLSRQDALATGREWTDPFERALEQSGTLAREPPARAPGLSFPLGTKRWARRAWLAGWGLVLVGAGALAGWTPGATRNHVPDSALVKLLMVAAALGIAAGVVVRARSWSTLLAAVAAGGALYTFVWAVALVESLPGPSEFGDGYLWFAALVYGLPAMLGAAAVGRQLRRGLGHLRHASLS